jgi:DNA repair exonuclease SbcCD ATPase subunit
LYSVVSCIILHTTKYNSEVKEMAGITEKDVFTAADELAAQGVKPTQTTVREHLGGGSFATIGPALKRWREAKWEQAELAGVELPPELAEALQQLGGRVWQAALDAAEARLAAERAALAEAREALESEAAEAAEAVKQLEAEAAEQQQRCADLADDLGKATSKNAELQQQIWQLQAQVQAAEAAAAAEVAKVAAVADERAKGLEARLADALRTVERLTEREAGG